MMPTPEEIAYLERLGFKPARFGAAPYWYRNNDVVYPTAKGRWKTTSTNFESPPLDTVFAVVAYAEVENWGR